MCTVTGYLPARLVVRPEGWLGGGEGKIVSLMVSVLVGRWAISCVTSLTEEEKNEAGLEGRTHRSECLDLGTLRSQLCGQKREWRGRTTAFKSAVPPTMWKGGAVVGVYGGDGKCVRLEWCSVYTSR